MPLIILFFIILLACGAFMFIKLKRSKAAKQLFEELIDDEENPRTAEDIIDDAQKIKQEAKSKICENRDNIKRMKGEEKLLKEI